jgi:hypothetical protein
MYYLVKQHRLTILLLITLLACLITLSTQSSVTSARAGAGSPMRLRLKVQTTTIKSGEATKIFVEFLDRDYQQVANDGTRAIEFGLGSARVKQSASGDISPQSVTVTPGKWSAETRFASRQAGKVLITARAAGLEPAQTLLVVTPPGSSFLSRLFETVAYADGPEGFEITPFSDEATANGNEQVICLASFTKRPPGKIVVRISVEPPAAILYNGRISTLAHIPLDGDGLVSPEFGIKSRRKGKVDIKASVLPDGPNDNALVNFIAPHPSRIIFGDKLQEISSTESTVPLLIELADDGGSPVEPVGEELITFKSANGEDFVKFDPPSVSLSTNRRSAQTMLQLSGLPLGNELKLLAVAQGQSNLTTGQKAIFIRSPIEKVMITGPTQVTRGDTGAEFTIRLTDKDGKHVVADWNRRITLSASDGWLRPTQVTIGKGEDGAKVQYMSPSSIGKVSLTANSGGLPPMSLEILVVTAPFWLVLAALFGGLVGGVARQIHKEHKLGRIMPRWNGECWELGLVGRVAGSVVSGLFLYWTMKFGLARMIGSPSLPAALDLGTRTVAFFFGGIGGFAGTVVFDRLVSWCLPPPKKEAQTPSARTGQPSPTRA